MSCVLNFQWNVLSYYLFFIEFNILKDIYEYNDAQVLISLFTELLDNIFDDELLKGYKFGVDILFRYEEHLLIPATLYRKDKCFMEKRQSVLKDYRKICLEIRKQIYPF